jgi:hypothetical protein
MARGRHDGSIHAAWDGSLRVGGGVTTIRSRACEGSWGSFVFYGTWGGLLHLRRLSCGNKALADYGSDFEATIDGPKHGKNVAMLGRR